MSDTLKDSYLLFNKKKYSDVIRILEPQVFRFRENFNFFYLLGMSCLHQGDYGGAFSYLRRAVDLRENDVNVLLGLAAVYLKRGDTGNALRLWLDIIDIDPSNIQAQRGLNYLKKNGDTDEFTSFSGEDKISRFLPQSKGQKKLKPALIIVPGIIFLIAAAALIPASRNYISNLIPSVGDKTRPGIAEMNLDERKDFLNLKGEHSLILTEKQVEDLFRNIQDYLYEYRDNLAQRDINTILLSNASEYVKDRARLLEKYVQAPDMVNFKDNFDYREVTASPLLYKNCYVLWKGKTTNLVETTEKISCDLLVGYHEEKALDGIIPVDFNYSVKIIPDQPVEILGKLLINDDGIMHLEGISLHRL
ncbi:MAG: tetratricopeptide repeat protein [Spirochaetales bacterium]|uniref:Tetratricopeptide repeat protein n=1 Tax=Candidatus Thalassospirochaeta sargassi TaxID=3119039 RepID=A0AAJ1ICX4_9SPIO|nr:tetratricopeptide repeat protein [Spirochaetales bacterium]